MAPRQPSERVLPAIVERVKRIVLSHPSHEYFEISKKLFNHDLQQADNPPDLEGMWQTLYNRNIGSDVLWIWHFLSKAAKASSLPEFHKKSLKDRKVLSADIVSAANKLSKLLTRNGLDAHLIYLKNGIDNDFFIYEDFDYSHRMGFDETGDQKMQVSTLIKRFAERTKERIEQEPKRGKAGKNACAIRFARIMTEHNMHDYDMPLYSVTATATNAVYGTPYSEGDICNLLHR